MLEIISNFARWSQLTANLILFGSYVFLAIIWHHKVVLNTSAAWLIRLEKGFTWLAGIVVLGLIGVLASTTGEATGDISNTWNPAAWWDFIYRTQVGFIAFIRLFLAVVLLTVVVLSLRRERSRGRYILGAFFSAFPLIAGTLVSHSSADEMSFASLVPFALHILLAGVWFGALPAFLLIVFDSSRKLDNVARLLNAAYLKKFSDLALPVMLLLVVTGLIVTDRMVDGSYHTLVSTSYGWLLNFKLIILTVIVAIAYQARYQWLPILSRIDVTDQIRSSAAHLKNWVRIEIILASLLMLIATILANTLPAKHAIVENWPFPFRFSIDATWEEPFVAEMFWFGVLLLFIALSLIWMGLEFKWNWKKKMLAPGALAITGMAIALPPITIEAYPETYLKPLVPLDAISISHGGHLFAEHCAGCHGPQGKGNGERAATLSTEPTDLLTEPHTARHTVGNFFHQVMYGIPDTDMPGFAETFTEEDTWDVVNFLHALSRGFDARLLGTMIVPETPAVASPVFFYSANDGSSGDLKDFRLKKNVILVFFTWPQSHQRFIQLKHAYERIVQEHNAEILAIPMQKLSEQALTHIAEIAPFPIITEGWPEIRDTYVLYRRVRAVPDLNGPGLTPVHMEFMIDRFGYLRARWNAQFEGFGWQNINALTQQLDLLNAEDEIMPPPGDHAH